MAQSVTTHAEPQARRLPDGAGKDLDLTRFDTVTTCRRPLIDYAYSSAARRTPGVEVRHGCPAAGLLTGKELIPGVPHVTGVRTASGETIDAKVVVDAAGRRCNPETAAIWGPLLAALEIPDAATLSPPGARPLVDDPGPGCWRGRVEEVLGLIADCRLSRAINLS